MTIIAFGSRSLRERPDQNQIVDRAFRIFLKECQNYGLSEKIIVFKHGAAPGADILMAAYAQDILKLRPIPFPAKWDDWRDLPDKKVLIKYRDEKAYNSLAGFNRNQEMIDSGFDAALCIRMPGKSSGSDDMIDRIKQLKKQPLMIFHVNGAHEWV
ncbi:MAG: hypothetical protein CV087_09770 [Candidatus Brocadia sp. WS118]|nr:MAG: hypothetical protein CV087_09770 [Candidatus Brocadia sp. WS118]